MHASELWHSPKPGPRLLRLALLPASWLYCGGWLAYQALYRFGLKRAQEPHAPVVCIGNLTVGGSGKTPLTLHVYDVLKSLGATPWVSVSGYGSPASEKAQAAPAGPLSAKEWGDEAAMLRWLRAEMPLIVGRNRVRAAEIAHQQASGCPLLLDDGFQHLPLKKHLTIVIDEPHPDNPHCLPAGPYREPRSGRKRADWVLPGKYQVQSSFEGVFRPDGTLAELPATAHGLCALGRPDRFWKTLEDAGIRVDHRRELPDHDALNAGTLFDGFEPNRPIVVTAKDWVKLRERPDASSRPLLIARHRVQVEPAEPFRDLLHATISQAP